MTCNDLRDFFTVKRKCWALANVFSRLNKKDDFIMNVTAATVKGVEDHLLIIVETIFVENCFTFVVSVMAQGVDRNGPSYA